MSLLTASGTADISTASPGSNRKQERRKKHLRKMNITHRVSCSSCASQWMELLPIALTQRNRMLCLVLLGCEINAWQAPCSSSCHLISCFCAIKSQLLRTSLRPTALSRSTEAELDSVRTLSVMSLTRWIMLSVNLTSTTRPTGHTPPSS